MINKLARRWLWASEGVRLAQTARAITAIQITVPLIVIHQKISAMRSAPRPAGSRADCGPAQPASDSVHIRRIREGTQLARPRLMRVARRSMLGDAFRCAWMVNYQLGECTA